MFVSYVDRQSTWNKRLVFYRELLNDKKKVLENSFWVHCVNVALTIYLLILVLSSIIF